MATDEASAELAKALGQSTSSTKLAGTAEESSLLGTLEGDGALESTLEQQLVRSTAQLQSQSAVDATLEEIQRLHIVEQELARANIGTSETSSQKVINQNQIETETLNKLKAEMKGKAGHKDKLRVEQLVQQQIEDQANAIEDVDTLAQNAEIMNYGNYIDNKDFTSTGEAEDQ